MSERVGDPGLIQKYQTLCSELKLPNPKQVSKLSWKRIVKKAVTEANRMNLLEIIQTKYEKLNYDDLKEETYEVKEYLKTMNLYAARMKFSIRSSTIQVTPSTVASYGTSHIVTGWTLDSQTHILSCDSYQYLRSGKDLSSDKDLVTYFREVISLREKLENIV